jgi:hypothetical protein
MKKTTENLKQFFPKTSQPISTKYVHIILAKEIKLCSNTGTNSFQRGKNQKNVKNLVGSFKNPFLKNH